MNNKFTFVLNYFLLFCSIRYQKVKISTKIEIQMKVSSTVPGKESGEVSPDSGSQGIKGVDIVYN